MGSNGIEGVDPLNRPHFQASLMLFIAGFSIGFGPVPWMMNGELFSSEAKSVGASLATATNWMCAFLISKLERWFEQKTMQVEIRKLIARFTI